MKIFMSLLLASCFAIHIHQARLHTTAEDIHALKRWRRNVGLCIKYPFPGTGFCESNITDDKISLGGKSVQDISKLETDLKDNFDLINDIIKRIVDQKENLLSFRQLLGLTTFQISGLTFSANEVNEIINVSLNPNTSCCLRGLKNLLCRYHYPSCIHDRNGTYHYTENICKEMCLFIRNSTCKDQTGLLEIIKKRNLIELKALDCNFFQDYGNKNKSCYISQEAKDLLIHRTRLTRTVTNATTTTTAEGRGNQTTATRYPLLTFNVTEGKTKKQFNFTRLTTTQQATTMLFAHIKKKYTDDIDNACPVYDKTVPNGECKEYLSGLRIAQTPNQLTTVSQELKLFYRDTVSFLNVLLGGKNIEKAYIRNLLGDCYLDNPEVKAFLDNATLPTLKDLDECLKQSKKLICHLHHPICLHAKEKRKSYQVKYSYTSLHVCKETCVAGESLCHKTIQIMRAAEIIRHACPIFKFASDKLLIIPSCENLPKADIRYIEKCIKLKIKVPGDHQSKMHQNISQDTSCYSENGENYRGNVNITISRKLCASWAKHTYLNKIVYPELQRNYCRNPQGYGSRPWCYTDLQTRTWEYCKVNKCKGNQSVTMTTKDSQTIIFSSLAVITLLGVLAVLLIQKKYKKKQNKDMDQVEPRNITNLKSPDTLRQQIDSFGDIDITVTKEKMSNDKSPEKCDLKTPKNNDYMESSNVDKEIVIISKNNICVSNSIKDSKNKKN